MLLAIFQFTKEFSKEYKYKVGESLKKKTIELLILIYRANTRHQKVSELLNCRTLSDPLKIVHKFSRHIQIFRSEATLPLPGGGWGVGQTKGACLPPASDGTKKAGQYDLLFMYPEPGQNRENKGNQKQLKHIK